MSSRHKPATIKPSALCWFEPLGASDMKGISLDTAIFDASELVGWPAALSPTWSLGDEVAFSVASFGVGTSHHTLKACFRGFYRSVLL